MATNYAYSGQQCKTAVIVLFMSMWIQHAKHCVVLRSVTTINRHGESVPHMMNPVTNYGQHLRRHRHESIILFSPALRPLHNNHIRLHHRRNPRRARAHADKNHLCVNPRTAPLPLPLPPSHPRATAAAHIRWCKQTNCAHSSCVWLYYSKSLTHVKRARGEVTSCVVGSLPYTCACALMICCGMYVCGSVGYAVSVKLFKVVGDQ